MNPSSSSPGLLARALVLCSITWAAWNLWNVIEPGELAVLWHSWPYLGLMTISVLVVPFLIWIFVLWLPRLLWDYGSFVWATAAAGLYLWLTYETIFLPDHLDVIEDSLLAALFGVGFARWYFGLLLLTAWIPVPVAIVVGIYMFVPRAFIAFRDYIRDLFSYDDR